MTRTQIQLPDNLYRSARELAKNKEISLAELVRRGLEYMITVSSCEPDPSWEMPEPKHLGGSDPFKNPEWRYQIHKRELMAAESNEPYINDSMS